MTSDPRRRPSTSVRGPAVVLPIQRGQRVVTHLPPHPSSAGAARSRVDAALRDWDCDAIRQAVLVVTSELVTNAIVHARSPFTVTVTRMPASVRIEVRDDDPVRPVVLEAIPDASDGHGMVLVERLSSSWSSYPTDDGGKVTWSEVSAAAASKPG